MTKFVHVAVGVICNHHQQILIAKRPKHVHQGDLWEFPGGKVEVGETVREALARELNEELNLSITNAEPFIQINHDYGDKQVLLDVWLIHHQVASVESMHVEYGREGQLIRWVKKTALRDYSFPKANDAIIDAIITKVIV